MLNLKACNAVGRGWSGLYFTRAGKGLKVIADKKEAKKEAENLIRLNFIFPGTFPRFYRIAEARVCGRLQYAIIMEHIEGKSCRNMSRKLIEKNIFPKLPKSRFWRDVYRENVIIDKNGKIRCIDTGSKLKKPQRREIGKWKK